MTSSIPPPRRDDFMHMWIDICSLYVCGMNIFALYIHISIHYLCIFMEMVLYCTYYLETCFSSLTILSLVSRFFFNMILYNIYMDIANCRRRQWHPTPVLLPGKSHGWRSLVGCSPWGC